MPLGILIIWYKLQRDFSDVQETLDNMLYPWTQPGWDQLVKRQRAGRMPHALLVTGLPGIGKLDLAHSLINSLLCQQPEEDGQACGQCKSCLLMAAGTHPDAFSVSLVDDKKQIGIDQIRELGAQLVLSSQLQGYRTAIIYPAAAMTHAAANSLLKTLEEPGPHTLILLVTSEPARLPATVRSRCQRVKLSVPDKSQAQQWLQEQGIEQPELALALAQGAPLKAVELSESNLFETRSALFGDFTALVRGELSPVKLAANWQKRDDRTLLYLLDSWLSDMVRLKFEQNPPNFSNMDYQQGLQGLSGLIQSRTLFEHLDRVRQALAWQDFSLNRDLLIEDVLIPLAPT